MAPFVTVMLNSVLIIVVKAFTLANIVVLTNIYNPPKDIFILSISNDLIKLIMQKTATSAFD